MSRPRPLQLIKPDSAADAPEPGSAAERSLLVRAAQQGDVRAFATLVDAYYARCLRFALHMLSNRGDAEEAVQDTFVRVYRALPSYEERESFEPWLFRILANRCRTAGARERRRSEFVEFGEVPERANDRRHDEAIAWREEIRRALALLPAEQREAFLMRHVEDLTYDDMAIATGAGISALKMRVKRACDALRIRLTEDHGARRD
ncbi:MAG TPA: sigma-70 family RNA polymerase sigma factor [Gemmatimonadaceae bacterium]|nr:sigma-70 family RNA polymerase sigma factor [Gemmatimonadaceae bacterium]